MKTPHLVSAFAALLILIAILIGGTAYAQSMEQRYVHALAGQFMKVNNKGSALQKIAFRQPDLLLIYGSSEIADRIPDYDASAIFQKYPTGFAPFEVAQSGVTSLMIAEQLASVGPDLRGKKVVISFTPSMFLTPEISPTVYAAMFSRMYANELAFSAQLDFGVKQAAARRMLNYPTTLENEPVLHFALQALAEDSPLDRALYYAVWPLGKLQTTIAELQDHWNTLTYFASHPTWQPEVPRQPAAIDWPALEAAAKDFQVAHTSSNPFGIPNSVWIAKFHNQMPLAAVGSHDKSYLGLLKNSLEWTDLDILLRVLTQLGARPLLLSRPINGTVWEAMGVSTSAQQKYYDMLQSIAAKYGVSLVDFQNHANDKYFSIDFSSHSSRLGWVYVDQTLDSFYHGTLR